MPTPVDTARQCLTEEASQALDDAVLVARRRNHAQTTSLHAISALLSSPSSLLRDSCSRARSSAYSPRLQFRALELCVGVSLDRLPSSKGNQDEPPPVSNSLMAAIKRSQANQRRQPEMYQLHQFNPHNLSPMSVSSIKVELKNFVFSILDDPIVSRVFGEAGFRSCDIKLAIVRPPLLSPVSPGRYLRPPRCPPLFLCNLTDSPYPSPRSFQFPFPSVSDSGDEYCRRIGEVLARKNRRNPLLVGVCAKDALTSFKNTVQRAKGVGLPSEIVGLNLFCLEKEVNEFLVNGGTDAMMNLKFKELSLMLENHSGPGIVVNFGELKVLVDGGGTSNAVKYLVVKLNSLVEIYGQKKLWLIGAAAGYETYLKFLDMFPSIEQDWDLSALPITSSSTSVEGLCSKSRLMGSFVPFGGFFTPPSEFRTPMSLTDQSFTRCDAGDEKCNQERSAIEKVGSSVSISDRHSGTVPSWLRMTDPPDVSKAGDGVAPAKEGAPRSNAKTFEVQKKWSDICQHLHQTREMPNKKFSLPMPDDLSTTGIQSVAVDQGSGSRNLYLKERICSDIDLQRPIPKRGSPEKQDRISPGLSSAADADSTSTVALEMQHCVSTFPSYPPCNLSLPLHKVSSSSDASVTTNLELGTPYASQHQEQNTSVFQDATKRFQCFSNSITGQDMVEGKNSRKIVESPLPTIRDSTEHSDHGGYKRLLFNVTENLAWQREAACKISQIISSHKIQNVQHRGSHRRGDIWLSFLGPDKVGKKKMAEALADSLFGSRESLVSVDLCYQTRINDSNSIFGSQISDDYEVKLARKTVVGYIAEELRKMPKSIVFLENVDEADPLVQNSLSHAVRTGKFPDSNGREISCMNMIFLTTCTRTKEERSLRYGKEFVKFSEETILEAKNWQMQLTIESNEGVSVASKGPNVSLTLGKHRGYENMRKRLDTLDSGKQLDTVGRAKKMPRNCLDLNMPSEDMEVVGDMGGNSIDSISVISRGWLEGFLDEVGETVIFKEFNFDALADKLLNKISSNFHKTVGLDIRLVVDYEAMVQILAAAWSSDRKGAVEEWIEQVLCRGFAEAHERYHLTEEYVVKLVSCAGIPIDDRAPGIPLPRKIGVN